MFETFSRRAAPRLGSGIGGKLLGLVRLSGDQLARYRWLAGRLARARPRLVIVYGRPDWTWIELYTIEAIEEIDAQIDLMQRGSPERRLLESIMHGAAEEAEIDTDGRLVLPQKLREKIGLEDSAFFIAAGDYLKLWKPDTYAAQGQDVEDFVATLEPGFDPRALLPALPRSEGPQT